MARRLLGPDSAACVFDNQSDSQQEQVFFFKKTVKFNIIHCLLRVIHFIQWSGHSLLTWVKDDFWAQTSGGTMATSAHKLISYWWFIDRPSPLKTNKQRKSMH